MVLTWTDASATEQVVAGFEGDLRVAEVVRCEVPRGWVGFLYGIRIPGGPWGWPKDACVAVEDALVGVLRRLIDETKADPSER